MNNAYIDDDPDYMDKQQYPPGVINDGDSIRINDEHGEICYWDSQEWIDDFTVVSSIVSAIKIFYEQGSGALREQMGRLHMYKPVTVIFEGNRVAGVEGLGEGEKYVVFDYILAESNCAEHEAEIWEEFRCAETDEETTLILLLRDGKIQQRKSYYPMQITNVNQLDKTP